MMRSLGTCIVLIAALSLSAAAQRQQPTFRAETNGVAIDVSVRRKDQPATGLTVRDFVVYDNGVLQTLTSVSVGSVPVDVTIFLGTNNQSAARKLESLSGDVQKIVSLLRPDDRVRVLTLGNQVTDVFGWRTAEAARSSINIQVGGVQSLYDACLLAMMYRPDPARRHLVVAITDGMEFGSVVDSNTVRDVARRAESVFHLVLLAPSSPPELSRTVASAGGQSPNNNLLPATGVAADFSYLRATWFHVMADQLGLEHLEEAARLTGGTVRRGESGETFVASFRKAFEDFRQSYVLRYSAEGVSPQGWHDVRVEMSGANDYTVRARKGYFGGQ